MNEEAKKLGRFERLFGWLIEQTVKLIWRVLVKPVLVAAFSPLLMVIGLAKGSNGASRRSVIEANEATNPAGSSQSDNAAGDGTRDLEGRKDHG